MGRRRTDGGEHRLPGRDRHRAPAAPQLHLERPGTGPRRVPRRGREPLQMQGVPSGSAAATASISGSGPQQ